MIVINYCHEDIPFAAMLLYRELRGRFGEETIVFDKGTLQTGMGFTEEISRHLADGSGAFIAMIGSRWTATMIAHQKRGDQDHVIEQIELALQHKWTVIPLLVDDATLPAPSQLPPAIRALPERQAARLRQTNLDGDIEDLCTRLNEIRDVVKIRKSLDPGRVEVPTPDVPPADDEHYQMLVDEADNLVIFLGAGANADDHEGTFQEGATKFPDDTDLAEYLAAKANLQSGHRDLAEVAQHAQLIHGERDVSKWVRQAVRHGQEPGPVHRSLARLPRRLEELGLEKRYQMIVTPKFDMALERAFREEDEPFDVAVYMAPGTEYAGRFVHLPWAADPQPILKPNEYNDFPIVTDYGELTRTVIVRTSGAVDDLAEGYRWAGNLIITQDDYIDYPRGRPAEEVVPGQILAKLREASCLFLGYTIADWRLRVFLHWIWRGERLAGGTHWAIERNPDVLERQFWQRSGVVLYKNHLTDYLEGFDRFLLTHRDI
jgi:SIR2-like domain/TIR domain